MKRNVQKVVLCAVCLCGLVGCATKQKNGFEATNGGDDQAEVIKQEYYGTILRTSISSDEATVRLLPQLDSDAVIVLNKNDKVDITGFSDKKDTVNGCKGYWFKIRRLEVINGGYAGDYVHAGWVFSKDVALKKIPKVSVLTVKSITPAASKEPAYLELEINRAGEKTKAVIVPYKMENQNFYTFVWCDDRKEFMYNDPVGTFKYFPDTKKIQHISYRGSSDESGWCAVTDDDLYLMQDFGTGPGFRGLGIYEIATNKSVFSGNYSGDIHYDGQSIVFVFKCSESDNGQKSLYADALQHAQEFERTVPLNEEQLKRKAKGISVVPVVKYKFYINTKKTEYLSCFYSINY